MVLSNNEDYLLNQYILARWFYRCAEERISDTEYNIMEEQIKSLFPNNEYLSRGWSEDPCPVELLKAEGREDLIKIVNFTYKTESIPSFRTWDSISQKCSTLNEQARLSYKHDGWNMQVNYFNGYPIGANTRGRDTNPMETDVLTSMIPDNISIKGRVKIFGELTIPNNKWERFKAETGLTDQRAAVSGALSRGLSDYLVYHAFNFIAIDSDEEVSNDRYSILKSWGFKVPGFVMVRNYQELVNGVGILGKMYPKYGLHADGLVLESPSYQIAIRVGQWAEQDSKSYVLIGDDAYTEEVTPYGRSLVLNIRPTKCEGKMIKQLTITNINRIVKFNLKPGAPVVFTLRSGANPVFSETGTAMLQREFMGEWEDYREMIDKGE